MAGDFLQRHGLLIGVVVLILIVWALSGVLRSKGPPYAKRPSLLTDTELQFFHVLREAVDGRWMICPMVRLADLLRVEPESPQRQAWQNRILAKHVDFILCDHESLEAQVAIELDDASHRRPDRQERDAFFNDALASAGVPLVRVPVASDYDPGELRKRLESSSGR